MNNGELEIFRLEDRVLFEAAAAAEIIDAADHDPNANTNETEHQAKEEKEAVKNAPPENPADAAVAPAPSPQPDKVADVDAEVRKLVEGEIPLFDHEGADAGDDALSGPLDFVAADEAGTLLPENGSGTESVGLTLNDHGETISTGRELVIINASVHDPESILAELTAGQEYLILDGKQDAMTQINNYLDASGGRYSAIHIVSHGNDGYFVLNGEIFDSSNFNAGEWAAVGRHLTGNGDILLYGCNLAESESGRDFVAMIADATGADVAASTDTTGIGGDWDLEYNHGRIETASLSVDGYEYRLNNFTVTVAGDSGKGSLRDAVSSAQSGDEITFSAKVTNVSLLSEITIDKSLTISGNGPDKTILDGGGRTRIFSIYGNDHVVNLNNLTLQNGYADRGGAIYNDHARVNISNVVFHDNTATGDGGAIYSTRTNLALVPGGILDLGNTVFYSNHAGGSGGAVFSERDGYVFIANSTFYRNDAGTSGGAIHHEGLLYLVDSTIAYNHVAADRNAGGGIYFIDTANIYNSIIAGNYHGASAVDDVYVDFDSGHQGAALTFAYSTYGNYNYNPSHFVIAATLNSNDGVSASSIFGAAPAFDNHTLAISNTSLPAYLGTLTGRIGDSFYFLNGNNNTWQTYGKTTFAFNQNGPSYGLTGGSVFTTAQNFYENSSEHLSRVDTFYAFTAGAYALVVNPGTVVNSNSDAVKNPFDAEITLRDALSLARRDPYRTISGGRVTMSHDITFATTTADGRSVFTNSSNSTIVLNAAFGEIYKDIPAEWVTNVTGLVKADGTPQITVKVPVTAAEAAAGGGRASNFRFMDVNAGTFNFTNMIFRGGDISAGGTDGNRASHGGIFYFGGYGSGTFRNVVLADSRAYNGGAIYSNGKVQFFDTTFDNGKATHEGGALYAAYGGHYEATRTMFSNHYAGVDGGAVHLANSSTMTVTDSTFYRNSALNYGGAIENVNDCQLTVVNSTFLGNFTTAATGNGGAIFNNNNAKLMIVDSTFTGNSAGVNGGAIFNASANTIGIINSILVGNTAKGAENNLYNNPTAGNIGNAGSANVAYTVYGVASDVTVGKVNGIGNTVSSGLDVFGTAAPALTAQGTVAIAGTGKGATAGTLVGQDSKGNFFFRDDNVWRSFSAGTSTTPFVESIAKTFGLEQLDAGASVLSLGQNGAGRTMTHLMYNAGAHALYLETPDVVVTTNADTVNPFDNLITLREAVAVYANSILYSIGSDYHTVNLTGKTSISFSTKFFYQGGANNTIVLDANLGEIAIRENRSITGLTDGSGNPLVTVKVPVTPAEAAAGGGLQDPSYFRLFNITGSGGMTVSFANLNLQGGDVSIFSSTGNGFGGAIQYIGTGGTLNLTNMIVSGAAAEGGGLYFRGTANAPAVLNISGSKFTGGHATGSGGGAAVYYGTLGVDDSEFRENTSASSGGGLFLSNGSSIIVNSVFLGNSANALGGAIAGNGKLTVADSTFRGNRTLDRGSSGGAIGFSGGEVRILNSILTGNSASNVENNISLSGNVSVFHMVYSIYGADSDLNRVMTNTGNCKAGSSVYSGNGYVISADGAAAYRGTLVARIGENFYYRDGQSWMGFGGKVANFNASGKAFGLGQYNASAAVISDSHNNVNRVQTHIAYNAGAFALAPEAPDVAVTTNTDALNPFDGKISLRDAIEYAGNSYTIGGRVYDLSGKREITFDTRTFIVAGGITVDPAFGAFVIAKNVSITGADRNGVLLTDAAGNPLVTLNGGGKSGIFNILSGTVALKNLNLQNGSAVNGSAIANAGSLTVTDVDFSGNAASGSGTVYNTGHLTVYTSTFTGNRAANGGGVYNTGRAELINSTFYANSAAQYGGGVYNAASGILTVADSTFAANSASVNGGGISNASGSATVLNSILLGNYRGNTSAASDIFTTGGTFNMAYNIYGASNFTPASSLRNYTGATVTDVFNAVWNGVRLVDARTGIEVLQNGTISISPYGIGAFYGTLVAWKGSSSGDLSTGNFYYRDRLGSDSWKSFSAGDAPLFREADNTSFGLGAGSVIFGAAQNGVSRIAIHTAYNMGSCALEAERPDVTVTTHDDIINPFDGKISLREAILYAGTNSFRYNGQIVDLSNEKTVTFDPTVFTSTNRAITVDATLGTFRIARDITIIGADKAGNLLLSAFGRPLVIIDGAGARQIFNITVGNVTLSNLALQNGRAADGGAVFSSATLTLDGVYFTGNSATGRGGAVYSTGTLTAKQSVFENNSAGNGGAVYAAGTFAGTNLLFSGNSASSDGGAVYAAGTAQILFSTFDGNSASGNGGAIGNANSLVLVNTTFHANRAAAGGALYSTGAVTVVDSTFAANAAASGGGALHLAAGTAVLLNNIVVGNYRNGSTADSDDLYRASGTVSMAYNVYGKANFTPDGTYRNTANATVEKVFNAHWVDGKLVNRGTAGASVLQNNVIYISPYGEGAFNGTLVGWRGADSANLAGGTFYFRDDFTGTNQWVSFDPAAAPYAFHETGSLNFGLGAGGIVFASAQNNDAGRPVYRTYIHSAYNAGAYALPVAKPGVVVTTNEDIVNPFDGLISLREAIMYSGNTYLYMGQIVDLTNEKTVTFDASVFKADNAAVLNTIVVNQALYGELVIDKDITITGLLNAGDRQIVVIDGDASGRIFSVAAGSTVTLNDLQLQNGKAEGGAIANAGTLNVNHLLFTGNASDANGGAVLNTGVLFIADSMFSGNTAAEGGAVFNTGKLNVSSTVFRGNSASGSGGAISGSGKLQVMFSTFDGNRAGTDGGAIAVGGGSAWLFNSTFHANSAGGNGGALRQAGGDLTMFNTTFAGNHAAAGGGFYRSAGNAVLVSNILVGNYRGTNTADADDIFDAQNGADLKMAYNVYGKINLPSAPSGNTGKATIADVFNAKWSVGPDGNPYLSNRGTNGVGILQGDTIYISPYGEGAFNGTLAGWIGSDANDLSTGTLYYRNDFNGANQWISFSTGTTYQFVEQNGVNFGLGSNAIVFAAAQNSDAGNPVYRTYIHTAYNAGAYALFVTRPDVVVTTNEDIVNPFDGVISLREAILYAGNIYSYRGETVDLTNAKTVTFSELIFRADNSVAANTIVLKDLVNYRTLTVDRDLTITGLTDAAGKAFIRIDGDRSMQIFKITGSGHVTALGNLILQNGSAVNGGAIENESSLTVSNVVFDGNQASSDGGAIYHSGTGSLEVLYSTFTGNRAGVNGDAIRVLDAADVAVVNSAFTGNLGSSVIYGGSSRMAVIDSTISANNGIGVTATAGSDLTILNSILVGNGTLNVNAVSSAYRMAFSLYGAAADLAGISGSIGNRLADSSIFVAPGGIEIRKEGLAAFEGTLVAKIGSDYFFRNGDKWDSFTATNRGQVFSSGSAGFGLGSGAVVYSDALNVTSTPSGASRVSRVRTDIAYNIGAYALVVEEAKVVVDTNVDTVNPFDGKITLREAAAYAGNTYEFDDGTSYSVGRDITFDGSFFTAGGANNVITLTLGEISIAGNLTITGLAGGNVPLITVDGNGGRIFHVAGNSAAAISMLGLSNADAGAGNGGAILNEGSLTVTGVKFDGNSAANGGAVYNAATGILTVRHSLFEGNDATNGGAVYNDGGTVSVTESSFVFNRSGNDGGAIFNSGAFELSESTLYRGQAGGNGGAALNAASGTLTIWNTTIAGNSAAAGGGISNAGSASLYNSVVLGNYAGTTASAAGTANDFANTGSAVMAYSVYGALSGGAVNRIGSTASDAANVFKAKWTNSSGGWMLAGISDGRDILTASGLSAVLPISAEGAAATGGTLVGRVGDTIYFRDGEVWCTADGSDTFRFDRNAADFGLTGGTVFVTAQNGEGRTHTHLAYNAGAYALPLGTVGNTVTIEADYCNPFDHDTSIREAVEYAGKSGGYIDFAGGVNSIVLNGNKLLIDYDLTIRDNPASAHRVTIRQQGDSGTILEIADGHTLTLTAQLVLGGGIITGGGDVDVTSSLAGSSATVAMTGGTFRYIGTGQTVLGGSYRNLELGGSTPGGGKVVKTLNGDIAVAGSFVMKGSANNDYIELAGGGHRVSLSAYGTPDDRYADVRFTDILNVKFDRTLHLDNSNTADRSSNVRIYLAAENTAAGALVYGQTLAESSVTGTAWARGIAQNGSYRFADGSYLPRVRETGREFDLAITAGNPVYVIAGKAAVTVTPKTIVVAVDPGQSKVYGQADPSQYTYTADGLVGDDALTGRLSRVEGENAGEYEILQNTLTAGSNYVVRFVGGEFTVTRRSVTVRADDVSKEYGAADPALTWTIVDGTLVRLDRASGELTRRPGEKDGSYEILQGSLNFGSNYDINFIDGTLTISGEPTPPDPPADLGHGLNWYQQPRFTNLNFTSESLGAEYDRMNELYRFRSEPLGMMKISLGDVQYDEVSRAMGDIELFGGVSLSELFREVPEAVTEILTDGPDKASAFKDQYDLTLEQLMAL
ncbi:MAG: DUF4347 domain-containing protein [Lentisphaeria bacterium]|nr:DUF4347 domain-containing protein [Lentisphaeria bacterium]